MRRLFEGGVYSRAAFISLGNTNGIYNFFLLYFIMIMALISKASKIRDVTILKLPEAEADLRASVSAGVALQRSDTRTAPPIHFLASFFQWLHKWTCRHASKNAKPCANTPWGHDLLSAPLFSHIQHSGRNRFCLRWKEEVSPPKLASTPTCRHDVHERHRCKGTLLPRDRWQCWP